VPVEIAGEPESTLSGAGMLGAYGIGLITDLSGAANMLYSEKTVIEPDEKSVRIYEGLQKEFTQFYEHVLGYWK
jgi:ribulose kinase